MNSGAATLKSVFIALALLGIAVPAVAQQKRDFVPAAMPAKGVAKPRGGGLKKGPQLGGERFVRRKTEQMAEAKWQEAFKLLKKLIEATPDRDPAKPDLFYRLSEMYWERASSTDILAFDQEERCLSAAGGNAANEAQCVTQREQTLNASKQYREQAIKVYKHIVRNFPRYPRLDGVLFALAFNYQQRNEPEKAKKIYIELIKRYPQSTHVADTLLNVGEIFFDAGQVEQALKAYEKVATSYQDSSVYGYALYKLGWCNYNLNRHTDALKYFLRVIEHTNDLQRSGQRQNRVMLKKEAQRDLVRTYVHIDGANPVKAVGFFRKVAPDDYLDLSERLAMLYGDTGQFQKSNILLRELIKLQPRSYRVVTFQRQISLNTRSIGQQVEAVRELKRLVSLWSTVKDAKDADPARVAKDRQGIEEQLRQMATQYHRLAVKTKAPKDYALAYDLYADYMKAFSEGAKSYDMTFYFAELLYNTRRWKEAARNYERTLELNPSGEFTKDAAHGAVLAYKKLLLGGGNENTESQPKMKGAGGDNTESTEIPEPLPISEDYERFLKAADLYRKYVTKSEYLVDIEYDAARVYYDLNHFDKAAPRFKSIAETHRDHRLAIYAANLLLDIYNLQKRFDELESQADIFLKMYPQERDPEFYALLIKIKQQSTFKRCSTGEAEKKYRQAARCFLNYAKKFPKSEFVDKALYNAALNYEREKMIEQSIQTKLALINNYSESELVPKALFQVAGNMHALAIFSEASKAYEFYAANFPDREEAKEALRFAALFRQGLGQIDQAVKNAKAYMKLIGKKDPEKAAEVYFSLGTMYEKQGDWDRVERHFKSYIKDYGNVGTVDLRLAAYTRLGNAYMSMKRKDENKAQRAYEAAYEAFKALPDAEKAKLKGGRAAVAEARFKMGEAIFREFSSMKLNIRAYRNVKKYLAEMTKKIGDRGRLIVKARDIYLEVINFRSANWAIAALARIGQMYQAAANDIYDAPAPGKFTEEGKEVFKGAMAEKAAIPEGKAIEAYVLCIKKAQELRWFNEWSDLSERQLAKLNPREYRYNAEQRAKPVNFGGMQVKPAIITQLKEQEEDG